MYMHICLYIAVLNTPLLIISPLTTAGKQAYFPWERNLRDCNKTFFKQDLLLICFCSDFNLTAAHCDTSIREVPVNLVANGIFPRFILLSQVAKGSPHFETIFKSPFCVPDVKLLILS